MIVWGCACFSVLFGHSLDDSLQLGILQDHIHLHPFVHRCFLLLAAANPELLQQASGLRDVLLAAGAVMLWSSIVLSMQMG